MGKPYTPKPREYRNSPADAGLFLFLPSPSMKLLLLASLLLAGAAHAQHAPARQPYTVVATTAAAFAQLPHQPANGRIVTDKQGFSRSGDTFVLRLTTGRSKRLLSKPGRTHEGDIAELSYLGKLPSLHKYVLHLLLWEDSRILLVDQRTGAIDSLQGIPILSPKASFVAATYQGYPYDGAYNGVEVFQVAASHLPRKFKIAQEKWIPHGLAWVDERSFIVKCLPLAEEEFAESSKLSKKALQNSLKFSYLRVTMR